MTLCWLLGHVWGLTWLARWEHGSFADAVARGYRQPTRELTIHTCVCCGARKIRGGER